MDFLNQASAQVTNLFRSMSMGARIVAGLLLAVIVISLAYLFNHQMVGMDAYLMGGEPVAADEINEITGALGKAGLKFELDGLRIRVPRGEEATYMAALVDAGAQPKNYGSYLQKALSDGGMLVSKAKQAQMNKVALQMELASVIRKLNGISNAAVFYDEEESSKLSRKKQYSASVMVTTVGGLPLDDSKVMTIRHLVASAISAEMPPESIAVADDNGGVYPPTKPDQIAGGLQDRYIQNKLTHEKQFTEKIRKALYYIPGVVVACNVELNEQVEHDEQKTQYDPKTVAVKTEEETKTANAQGPQLAGDPGLAAQRGIATNQPAVVRGTNGASKSDEEIIRSNVQSLAPGSQSHIRMAGLTPKRVQAAIAIPRSHIRAVWLERNPSPAGTDPKQPTNTDLKTLETELISETQMHVAQILDLPKEAAANPIPLVRVTVFDKLQSESLSEPGISDHALAWLGAHWSTLGTGLLGLVSLVMLRSMVRAAPAAEPLPAINPVAIAAQEAVEPTTNEPKTPAAARLRRRDKSGPSLREELVEVVREDPDAAANVLRSWINSST
jgi:flagellar M-ring protein FliF